MIQFEVDADAWSRVSIFPYLISFKIFQGELVALLLRQDYQSLGTFLAVMMLYSDKRFLSNKKEVIKKIELGFSYEFLNEGYIDFVIDV